ncbi:MAG: hypothetical protein ACI9A7_002128 [Cyclobacteriaceae bacterium]|jgi:hypothetical protein
MFNIFKKKKKEEPLYDVTNLSVKDLDVNFVFDYDMKSWIVREVYEYDWGNNSFTREYKVDSGDEVAFLEVEDDDELYLVLSNSISLRKIEEDVVEKISKKGKSYKKIHYAGETYFLEEDSAGYFKNAAKKEDDWEEFITWEYLNEEETRVVSLTQWDEQNVEASAGIVVKPYQISNILPGADK